MLATAIIIFRECLEAALIIGIVAAATRGVPHRGVWICGGAAVGCMGAVLVAALANVIMSWADGMGQDIFNAGILLVAVVMLAWHNIWMAQHSKELTAEMRQVGAAVTEGRQSLLALLVVVALAILREGSESVLFLYSQFAQELNLLTIAAGATLGLAAGVIAGLLMYGGLLRIPTRYLFQVTGWMILLLAAGMASQAVRFLIQADKLPAWGNVWNASGWLPNNSLLGSVLHTLIGYDASPTGMQLLAYIATLCVVMVATRWANGKSQPLHAS